MDDSSKISTRNNQVAFAVLLLIGLALGVGLIVGGLVAGRPAGESGNRSVSQPNSVLGPDSAREGANEIDVHFSPGGGCTQAIVAAIDRAREVVLVQAYSFTSRPIGKALVDAQRRGVRVSVIFDSENERQQRYSEANFLGRAGIAVYLDAQHVIAHAKIMIIDHKTVITGSFNFTRAAEERNSENVLVIRATPAIIKAYEANFSEHLEHSKKFDADASNRR